MSEQKVFDFIIIGGGLAGLYSAYHASHYGSVALISKSDLTVSCSYLAQGGIAAAMGEDDSPQIHFDDTMRVGKGLCNKKAVEILVSDGKETINELITLGMKFDTSIGKLDLGLEGGHSRRRILHADGSSTGRAVTSFVFNLVSNRPNIQKFTNAFVYDLIIKDGICYGIKMFNEMLCTSHLFFAGKTIIASGGAAGIYERTTNPFTSVGDGLALAFNAGAIIENMEFMQFHPTALSLRDAPTFLLSEALRGEGALLVDENDKRILAWSNKTELSPRDELSQIIYEYLNASKRENVFLKLFHLDSKKIIERFSYIYNELIKVGIDITKDPIPVSPAAHYTVGGIKTGLNGETNISGLYAVGEVASSGVHGANRLASNSLLECLVFSKRAVVHSSKLKSRKDLIKETSLPLKFDKPDEQEYETIMKIISSLMWKRVGIIRTEESLTIAKNTIDQIAVRYLDPANNYYSIKIRNMLRVALLIIDGALLRKESRGCHIRKDFPQENISGCSSILQSINPNSVFEPIK